MRRWVIIISIVLVVGALGYALYAMTSRPATPVAQAPEAKAYAVTYGSSYAEGIHTIEGTVLLDTPCQELAVTASTVGTNVRVDVVAPPDTGICLQREDARAFSVDAEAPEDAGIAVFVNGIPAIVQ